MKTKNNCLLGKQEDKPVLGSGLLLVVSGPSGTGKGTVCQALLQQNTNLNYSISATTRQPRPGEVHGVNYWFTAKEEFQKMIARQELLEWAEVYGNYYGTPKCYVEELLAKGKDVVLEIDTQGAMKVKEQFAAGVFIFIAPPSLDELAKRIHNRGTEPLDVIKKRLSCTCQEINCAQNYDYVVVNDQVELAVKRMEAIIIAEKCRLTHNNFFIEQLCRTDCKQDNC